jgi:hypothetical protein
MADNKSKSILKMSEAELFRHVKSIAGTDANIILTDHTKYVRMGERRISLAEVLRCIKLGRMTRAPEPGKFHDELKCRLDHFDYEKNRIGVEIVVSDGDPNLIVVTVIRYV